jgi:hypothetical protein
VTGRLSAAGVWNWSISKLIGQGVEKVVLVYLYEGLVIGVAATKRGVSRAIDWIVLIEPTNPTKFPTKHCLIDLIGFLEVELIFRSLFALVALFSLWG